MADRFDRRRLLLVAQCISAAGTVGLAIWVGLTGVDGLPGTWPIFAASGVIGLGYAVGISSMNGLIPALVEEPDLEDAIALNSASFTLARAIGPAVAGLIVAAAGAAWAFGINALTFIPLIFGVGGHPAPPYRAFRGGSVGACRFRLRSPEEVNAMAGAGDTDHWLVR